jgi:DNA-directed RNA polymerase specialized sigma24 family protein
MNAHSPLVQGSKSAYTNARERKGKIRVDRGLAPDEIRRLRQGLRIMALQALGDRDAAEEVAQETLVRTLQALRDESRKAPEHLGAFVRGIARHVISDMWDARRCARPLEALPGGEGRAPREDPLSALVTQEEGERVRRALQRLHPRTATSCTSLSSKAWPRRRSPIGSGSQRRGSANASPEPSSG